MIIVLSPNATKLDTESILNQIQSLGLKPLYLPGEEKIVLGAIGDERKIALLGLENLHYVERVVPILKPYKLSSRDLHPSTSIVSVGACRIGDGSLTMIAGPCSVESEEQIVTTALQLKSSGVNILRGGAYKPRTSPYSFQGLEEEGLRLLALARQETGIPVVTEIISEYHLETVAKYTDMFQIGARNMQNFRLLKAVGSTKIPVLLKRGLVASLEEWLMAAEYILSEGNPNVVLCERGIKSFFQETRNTFDLSVIPLARAATHLPIIADPSHATGLRSLIEPMSLAAVAAGADGLIVEVHPNPDKALSDGKQQITPQEFSTLATKAQRIHRALTNSSENNK